MALDAESVIDRRRLKRRVSFWRVAAIALGVAFIIALSVSGRSGSGTFLPHVARVSISGVITDDEKLQNLLEKISKSDQVKAVILDINSPGGTTTGGEALYDAVRRVAEKKPVVAVCGTLATSAAYIVALATDRIFVYGNTITGSVGVIFQWADVTELMKTLGIKVEEVRSGPLKAVPNPFEPADERAREMTEDMVQEAKVWFVDLVEKRRELDADGVPGLTEGRIYSGRQAVQFKLVDQIGDQRAAVNWLRDEGKIASGLKVVEWKPQEEDESLIGWIFGSLGQAIGVPVEHFASIFSQVSSRLKLDGLISVWHPSNG